MWFLECCGKFEQVADFAIRKGALVDLLIADKPGPEEIVRGPDDGVKDEAIDVELSSFPIRSCSDLSREEVSKGNGESGWFSVPFIRRYQMFLFNKTDKNRFWSFASLKEIVTQGPVLRLPPVLLERINIFLVPFGDLI